MHILILDHILFIWKSWLLKLFVIKKLSPKNCYITKLRTEESVCKERAKGRGSFHELARYVLLGANIIVMNSV